MIEFKVFLESALVLKTALSKLTITIGRSDTSDLVLPNRHVSRTAAIIEHQNDTPQLIDKSRNGLLLNSQRVDDRTPLPKKCRIAIYPFEIECCHYPDDETIPLPAPCQPTVSSAREPSTAHTPQTSPQLHFSRIIGESPAMYRLYELIQSYGDTLVTALIQGEHGTGKELVARALHDVSARRAQPYVPVNCAAIPSDLIESELFGYEKGAFTGAQSAKSGKIEEARGGTLFLDEVGELSMAAQAKLLRFLQEKAIMRIGSSREIPVDVRVISATNRNLAKAAAESDFREDLYFRLRVAQILLPPLRERMEDLPLLIRYFLRKLSNDIGLAEPPLITDKAVAYLQSISWPGNVRQLENTLYSAMLRSRTSHIIEHTTLQEDASPWPTTPSADDEAAPLDTVNKQALLRTLEQHQWDTAKTAKVLQVSRGTVYYKMKKYGIEPPRSSSRGGSA